MTIKRFGCGLCKNNQYIGTRYGLRKHIKEVHVILSEITNKKHTKGEKTKGGFQQRWWLTEDCKYGE